MTNITEKILRKKIRSLLKEEVSTGVRKQLTNDLETSLEECLEQILLDHRIHTQGLSPQQASHLYRRLCGVISKVIDDFTTMPKPGDLAYDDYIEKYDY